MKRQITSLLIALVFAGCASMYQLDLTRISIGMSKEQVIKAIGRKPNQVIASKRIQKGLLEVYQYSNIDAATNTMQYYWLGFIDDKLVQWGRPQDWQKDPDFTQELRIKQ